MLVCVCVSLGLCYFGVCGTCELCGVAIAYYWVCIGLVVAFVHPLFARVCNVLCTHSVRHAPNTIVPSLTPQGQCHNVFLVFDVSCLRLLCMRLRGCVFDVFARCGRPCVLDPHSVCSFSSDE